MTTEETAQNPLIPQRVIAVFSLKAGHCATQSACLFSCHKRKRTPFPGLGLALGSGSARGWAHIGAIGIEPDIVCGTSIGALVGAAYVAGRLTDLRQWAEAATWREIIGLMDVRFSGGGLIDGKEVVEFLRRLGIGAPIESYAKAYAATTGREIWLQSWPIHEAVRPRSRCPRFSALHGSTTNGLWTVASPTRYRFRSAVPSERTK